MPTNDPLIFTPPMLSLLGLEHDPQRQNESTPYPYAYDRAANESVFFNPVGCMVSFRMLQRALARLKAKARIFIDGGTTVVNMDLLGRFEGTCSTGPGIEMVELYSAAVMIILEKSVRESALASP